MEYTFYDIDSFPRDICSIEKHVPLRSKGRKTEHTERYSLVSFLEAFHLENLFTFPFKVIFRDRPDVLIVLPKGNVGLEITEAIPEQLARAQYLLEKNFAGLRKLEPQFFGWDAPERNDEEILEILRKSQVQLIGKPPYGNSIEDKWLIGIEKCITNKTKKLSKPGFEKFKTTWLLIYDNQSDPTFDDNYVLQELSPLFDNYWNINIPAFDKIFIDLGKRFFLIENGSALLVTPKAYKK
jgi:hypothetical protein